jgi:hypothetical protein
MSATHGHHEETDAGGAASLPRESDWFILAKQNAALSRQMAIFEERLKRMEVILEGTSVPAGPNGRDYVKVTQIIKMFPVSRATVFRMLKKYPPAVLHRKYAGRALMIDSGSFERCLPDFVATVDAIEMPMPKQTRLREDATARHGRAA